MTKRQNSATDSYMVVKKIMDTRLVEKQKNSDFSLQFLKEFRVIRNSDEAVICVADRDNAYKIRDLLNDAQDGDKPMTKRENSSHDPYMVTRQMVDKRVVEGDKNRHYTLQWHDEFRVVRNSDDAVICAADKDDACKIRDLLNDAHDQGKIT